MSFVCTLAVLACGFAGTPAQHAHAANAPTSTPTAEVEAANRAAATAEAHAALGRLALPAGAEQLAGEPADDGGLLGGASLPDTPNLADATTWWRVPGTMEHVYEAIQANPPAGARLMGNTPVPIARDQVALSDLDYEWPATSQAFSDPGLVVTMTPLANGGTGVRVDGTSVWRTPRPADERVPTGARLLRITVGSLIRSNRPVQRPLLIRRRPRIEAIAAILNGLGAAQPGVRSCPADFGVRVQLNFFTRQGTAPVAVASINPAGCEEVGLKLGGVRQPTLEGGGEALEAIDKVLGRTIGAARPSPRGGP
jgi:hypothetical protein